MCFNIDGSQTTVNVLKSLLNRAVIASSGIRFLALTLIRQSYKHVGPDGLGLDQGHWHVIPCPGRCPCSTAVAGPLSRSPASWGFLGGPARRYWRCSPASQTAGPGHLGKGDRAQGRKEIDALGLDTHFVFYITELGLITNS